MKITKRQLKRIIKEEKAKLLKENQVDYSDVIPGSLNIPRDTAELAENGAHQALMHIQGNMGIETGDNASLWDGWDQLVTILEDYIQFEIDSDHLYR